METITALASVAFLLFALFAALAKAASRVERTFGAVFGKPSANAIGAAGEARVIRRLGRLPPGEYAVLNDLVICDGVGATTQIDHVVVSRFGIFSIETKCYKGWIFGGERDRFWTQTLYRGRGLFGFGRLVERHRFQNPIRQNWRHVCVMAERLRLPKRFFRSVVVFSGDAEFKTGVPGGVVGDGDLVRHILSFGEPLMDAETVARAVSGLRRLAASVTDERREAHAASLAAAHAPAPSVSRYSNPPKCPRCGAKMRMRLRRSDSAPFFGCSRYPQCHGVVNITA